MSISSIIDVIHELRAADSAGGCCTSSYSVKFETQRDGDEHILQVFTTLDRDLPGMPSPVVETANFAHSLRQSVVEPIPTSNAHFEWPHVDSDETVVDAMGSLEFSELDMSLSGKPYSLPLMSDSNYLANEQSLNSIIWDNIASPMRGPMVCRLHRSISGLSQIVCV